MFFVVILSMWFSIVCDSHFSNLKKDKLFVASPCSGNYYLQQVAQRSSRKSRPLAHTTRASQHSSIEHIVQTSPQVIFACCQR